MRLRFPGDASSPINQSPVIYSNSDASAANARFDHLFTANQQGSAQARILERRRGADHRILFAFREDHAFRIRPHARCNPLKQQR